MKAADRARRRPAAADRNAEALLWRRGAGACTRQIDLFCAPQLMSTEVPRSAQIFNKADIARFGMAEL
jgi:hypothetical protein